MSADYDTILLKTAMKSILFTTDRQAQDIGSNLLKYYLGETESNRIKRNKSINTAQIKVTTDKKCFLEYYK